ncbi:unnamed protein product, partial [marine sediment metagenome]
DCPEKKEFPEVQMCSGDCQGTYLSVMVKENIVKIVGSIFPKPHIMYNEEFVSLKARINSIGKARENSIVEKDAKKIKKC